MHCTVVADDHDDVLHSADPTNVAEGVKLYAPKLRPAIVTVPPPELAELDGAVPVSTGASNVKSWAARVPTIAPTVTLAPLLCTFVAAAAMQLMAVLLVQADVPQVSLLPSTAVSV